MVADLHCHPTLPALNTKADMWNYDPPNPDERSKLANTSAVNGFTQGDYTSLCKARARLIFNALYPVEQGFLCSEFPILQIDDKESFFGKLWRRVAKGIDSGARDRFLRKVLSKIIYNMTADRFREITSDDHNYFEDLKKEHQKFVSQAVTNTKIDGMPAHLRVIQNYSELKQLLNINSNYEIGSLSTNTVAVIFSVEGGHSLGCGQKNTIFTGDGISLDAEKEIELLNNLQNDQTQALLSTLKNNIRSLKKIGSGGIDDDGSHCPFYMTFTHHFWNQLCGSAMSYAHPANDVFDQLNGLTTGFTEVGKVVLQELLSKENGKRILIDVKHMSYAGRQFYYSYLRQNFPGENIPIIASHMGVNGLEKYDPSYPAYGKINVPSEMDKAYKNSKSLLNIWDINLFDDDIIAIHMSGGIIGLNFDQRILAGKLQVDNMTKVTNAMFSNVNLTNVDDDDTDAEIEMEKMKQDIITSPIYRSIWAQPFVENILHIIKTIINSNSGNTDLAWERVCIGSDFDGLINALDAYCHAEDFDILRNILIQKFSEARKKEPLLESKNIEDLVDGFMYKNLLKFLERNFK